MATSMRPVLSVAVFVAGAACAATPAPRADLKETFRAGKLELTFTAKDRGATLDLKVKNQTKDKLMLVIPAGKTTFDIHDNPIALVAAAAKNIDLEPLAETTVSFPMEQSGGGRWSSGSVTQSMTPPAKPEE